ncbi:hypothetical protein PR003_g16261 [Phytophthora rubi]|uniref:Uncharacterized protein n=1 Tax=Phytophthora rubi TaxID=129364 RepID=A0A6A3KXT8_9STRA|nr:hypothetical protein PR002_g15931 [Phytophthora rubi]KAE9013160.1 hypothetical protein PR001_g15481 [Phytophthora rubi]KAE9326334.1 hypothetical protein PR003_g16261 [Phytophthora rubi]
MPAKKTAPPKRKRSAPAPSGDKKKQSVAAKQKHVRERAKTGRWVEIERLYGKKMVAKAKIYAEKHHVTKTPQEIARDILLKNGYIPVAPQPAAKTAPASRAKRSSEPSTRVNSLVVDLTDQVEPSSSPGTLTKEQQELIERRRRDALERRRRAQKSVQLPVATQIHPVENLRGRLMPSSVLGPELEHRQYDPPPQAMRLSSNRPPAQPSSTTHRVVTPDNLPTANPAIEAEQVRPEYFWDDLEAAAEIVQWENEHMAEVALEKPSVAAVPKSFHGEAGIPHPQQVPEAPQIPSISQELAAAAEIIQWENEHEHSPEIPEIHRVNQCNDPAMTVSRSGDSSDSDLDAPQFQLLQIDTTEVGEPQRQTSSERATRVQPSKKLATKPKASHKRPLEATPLPVMSEGDVVSNKAENARGRPALPPPRGQRDPTTEFMYKHLLDDKLELPVLEFLDMMLA